MQDPNEIIEIPLTNEERSLLVEGLLEWGGPAACTDKLAIAMGFESVDALFDESKKLRASLENAQPLSRRDWTRVLMATEIVFISDIVGSGADWQATTGFGDVETIQNLRQLQRKLMKAGALSSRSL